MSELVNSDMIQEDEKRGVVWLVSGGRCYCERIASCYFAEIPLLEKSNCFVVVYVGIWYMVNGVTAWTARAYNQVWALSKRIGT
jgi:hypothetical protein